MSDPDGIIRTAAPFNTVEQQADDKTQQNVPSAGLPLPNEAPNQPEGGLDNPNQPIPSHEAPAPLLPATAAIPNPLLPQKPVLNSTILTAQPLQPAPQLLNVNNVFATPLSQPAATALPQQAQVNQNMILQQFMAAQQQQRLQQGGPPLTPQQQQQQALQLFYLYQQQQIQQQQRLMLAQHASATTSTSGMPMAAPRTSGAPPAKRQAIDTTMVVQQAKNLANQQYQHLLATGQLNNVAEAQRPLVFQNIFNRIYHSVYEHHSKNTAQPQRNNMRISNFNKKDRTAGDKLFIAEDTTKNNADEIVQRCEEISRSLRSHLGKGFKNNHSGIGSTDTDAAASYVQITQQQLIEYCGDTARYLKPYQIVGVNFLMLLYNTKIGGAILADEMGLGKTAQLITYLGAIRAISKDPGPHLVVVPASLLENWQRELRRWCPAMKSIVYYGKHRLVVRKRLNDLRERMKRGEVVDDDLADLQDADILAEQAASERMAEAAAVHEAIDKDPLGLDIVDESDGEYDMKRDNAPEGSAAAERPELPPREWDFSKSLPPAPFDVMLTSYTLFERDSPEQRLDREFLESFDWSHLVMDEAHALKNKIAQRTTRLQRVANCSRRRIMMTGTPLQNDLIELQNLMHLLLPQIFSKNSQQLSSFEVLLHGNEDEIKRLTHRMKQLLGPFVLRRLKSEVAGQLTEKKHTTEFIDMTPEQAAMYENSLQNYRDQFSNRVATTNADGTSTGVETFVKSVGAKKVNHMFTHLRKIAQHPLLIRHHYDDKLVEEIAQKSYDLKLFSGNANLNRITEELSEYSDYALHAFCYNSGPEFVPYRLTREHLMTSTKFRFLADILPKLKEAKSRPLIFSQWTNVLDIIEWLMDELRLPYVRLDGSTAVDVRLATVDRFNTSEDVFAFLLSTRAGGQGLNLTGADTVILHDVDFNPQIDRQAEDRCHRLGQTKPVMVYRLITKASVDQNIYDLSQRKLKLDHAVLDGITTGKGAKQRESAQERQHMGFILQSLFAGKTDYDEMMAQGIEGEGREEKKEGDGEEKKEGEEGEKVPLVENGQDTEVKTEEEMKAEEETAIADVSKKEIEAGEEIKETVVEKTEEN